MPCAHCGKCAALPFALWRCSLILRFAPQFLCVFGVLLGTLTAELGTERLQTSNEALVTDLQWEAAAEAGSFDDAWEWLEQMIHERGNPNYDLITNTCQGDTVEGTVNGAKVTIGNGMSLLCFSV